MKTKTEYMTLHDIVVAAFNGDLEITKEQAIYMIPLLWDLGIKFNVNWFGYIIENEEIIQKGRAEISIKGLNADFRVEK